MGLSSSGSSGINHLQSSVNISQAKETAADVKETAQGMKDIMNSIKELSQELRNQQMQKLTTKEENSKLEQKTDRALDQLKEQGQAQQKQVQSQQQAQQSQLGAQDTDIVAAAMAALIEEDELDEANDKQKTLEEKMDLLMKEAEGLQDVELNNPDQNYELQQMFKNIEKFKSLKRREGQLNKQIEDLEINLKNEEKKAVNSNPGDDSIKKIRDQLITSSNQMTDADDSNAQDSKDNEEKKDAEEDNQSNKNKDN